LTGGVDLGVRFLRGDLSVVHDSNCVARNTRFLSVSGWRSAQSDKDGVA
jgi:hypothetical protein